MLPRAKSAGNMNSFAYKQSSTCGIHMLSNLTSTFKCSMYHFWKHKRNLEISKIENQYCLNYACQDKGTHLSHRQYNRVD